MYAFSTHTQHLNIGNVPRLQQSRRVQLPRRDRTAAEHPGNRGRQTGHGKVRRGRNHPDQGAAAELGEGGSRAELPGAFDRGDGGAWHTVNYYSWFDIASTGQ